MQSSQNLSSTPFIRPASDNNHQPKQPPPPSHLFHPAYGGGFSRFRQQPPAKTYTPTKPKAPPPHPPLRRLQLMLKPLIRRHTPTMNLSLSLSLLRHSLPLSPFFCVCRGNRDGRSVQM
ncbi:hypothetical protein HanIR_Chr16g0818691 [Helianthus annuus]|nr:hypothetical protein HanIR_Chr16g0818691 [Helianthus annuus]